MSPNVGAPPPEAPDSACEPWTDQLSKALATGIPRRTILKLLAGAAFTSMFGLTTACGSVPTHPTTPTTLRPTPTPTASVTSACPPLQLELCCTPDQLEGCEKQGATVFAQAIGQCAGVCSHTSTTPTASPTAPPSPQCQACIQAVTNQSLAAYTTCTASVCLVLVDQLPPASATPSPTALGPATGRSAPMADGGILPSPFTELTPSTADQLPCDYAEVEQCVADAKAGLASCLSDCSLTRCPLGLPVGLPECGICAGVCYTTYGLSRSKCLLRDGCPAGESFCSPGDVCCQVGQEGCNGKGCCNSNETCCADGSCCGRTCCGATCCPDNSMCVNGECQCQASDASGQSVPGKLCGTGDDQICCPSDVDCVTGPPNTPITNADSCTSVSFGACCCLPGYTGCNSGQFSAACCPPGYNCCAVGCCPA